MVILLYNTIAQKCRFVWKYVCFTLLTIYSIPAKTATNDQVDLYAKWQPKPGVSVSPRTQAMDQAQKVRTCLHCSAPKHLTFNPTFPQKQKLFSRKVKDLVILPLLQEICKDKMRGLLCKIVSLGAFIFQNIALFRQKNNIFDMV